MSPKRTALVDENDVLRRDIDARRLRMSGLELWKAPCAVRTLPKHASRGDQAAIAEVAPDPQTNSAGMRPGGPTVPSLRLVAPPLL